MFNGMTPDGYPYFAGHYRGERLRCLRYYEVKVDGDNRVGTPAGMVANDLRWLATVIREGIGALNAAHKLPNKRLSAEDKLYYVVTFACRVLVEFMRIHPYANGNGHMGRLIVWAVLGAYGIWPRKWPLHERPPDPPYSQLLPSYRDGIQLPLEKFVLQCVIG